MRNSFHFINVDLWNEERVFHLLKSCIYRCLVIHFLFNEKIYHFIFCSLCFTFLFYIHFVFIHFLTKCPRHIPFPCGMYRWISWANPFHFVWYIDWLIGMWVCAKIQRKTKKSVQLIKCMMRDNSRIIWTSKFWVQSAATFVLSLINSIISSPPHSPLHHLTALFTLGFCLFVLFQFWFFFNRLVLCAFELFIAKDIDYIYKEEKKVFGWWCFAVKILKKTVLNLFK